MSDFEDGAPEPAAKAKKKKDRDRNVWISFIGRIVAQVIGAIASVALGILVLQRYQDRPSPMPSAAAVVPANCTPGQQTIAVLRLDNFSGNLGTRGVARLSRTSTEVYRSTARPVAQIGGELGADLIVDGSVTKVGDQVRVVVQLIDARTDGRAAWCTTTRGAIPKRRPMRGGRWPAIRPTWF